jgi:hypothetical protein
MARYFFDQTLVIRGLGERRSLDLGKSLAKLLGN